MTSPDNNVGAGVLSRLNCAVIALDDYSMEAKGQPSPTAQGLRAAIATIESAMALPGGWEGPSQIELLDTDSAKSRAFWDGHNNGLRLCADQLRATLGASPATHAPPAADGVENLAVRINRLRNAARWNTLCELIDRGDKALPSILADAHNMGAGALELFASMRKCCICAEPARCLQQLKVQGVIK